MNEKLYEKLNSRLFSMVEDDDIFTLFMVGEAKVMENKYYTFSINRPELSNLPLLSKIKILFKFIQKLFIK